MGSALSRKQADDTATSDAADVADQAVLTESVAADITDESAEITVARTDVVIAATIADDAPSASTAEISATNEAAATADVSQDLPADIAMIMQAGLHADAEPAPSTTSKAVAGHETSEVKATVQELRDKFGINKPMTQADVEQVAVRKELNAYEDSLKERLKRMRQAHSAVRKTEVAAGNGIQDVQKQSQLEQASSRVASAPIARSHRSNSSSSASSEASSSSSSAVSAAGSSSSSGSSLHLKPRGKRQKLNNGKAAADAASQSDEDEDDEEDKAAIRKALKQASVLGPAVSANPMFASKHEVLDPSVPTVAIEKLPEGAAVYPFGVIESVINSVIVIRAGLAGDISQILDEGSLACLEDGRVLGPIFETFGAITAPMYSVRMPSHAHPLISITQTIKPEDAAVNAQGLDDSTVQQESDSTLSAATSPARAGVKVFYCPDPAFSTIVYTRDVKLANVKGSDASNLYDEEPAGAEIEFSDDEQEQAYKQALKQRRRERRLAYDEQYGQNEANGEAQEFEFDDDDDTMLDEDRPQAAGLEEDEPQDSSLDNGDLKLAGASAGSPRSAASLVTGSGHPAISKASHTKPISSRALEARSHVTHATSRGQARESRGRGRGRGRGDAALRPSRGRGYSRGSSSSDWRGLTQPYTPRAGPAMLPRKPAFQHPDALPYDNVLPYDGPGNATAYSPMSASLPPRPMSAVEPYVPMNHLQRSPTMASSAANQNHLFTNPSAGYNPGYRSNWEQPGYTPQHAMPMQGPSASMPQLYGASSSGMNASPMLNRPNSGPFYPSNQPMYTNGQQWQSR